MTLDEAETKCREWFGRDFPAGKDEFRFIHPRHSIGASAGIIAWHDRSSPKDKQGAVCIIAHDGIEEETLKERWLNAVGTLHNGIAEVQSRKSIA